MRRSLLVFAAIASLIFTVERSHAEESAATLTQQAIGMLELGQIERAKETCDQALKLDPKYAEALRQRAVAHSCLRREEAALEDSQAAKKLDPDSPQNTFTSALLKVNLRQDFSGAIADLDTYVAARPKEWRGYNVRGFAQLQLRRYAEAIADFDQCIALEKSVGNPYQLRGECYYTVGEYERAAEDYEQGIALTKKPTVRQYYTAGECHFVRENFEKAAERFRQALNGSPEDANCYEHIADCELLLGKNQKALQAADAGIKAAPTNAYFYLLRGQALWRLGQTEEAEKAFSEAKGLGWDENRLGERESI